MPASKLKRWLVWVIAALAVVAVFAFTMPLSRSRVIAGGVVALALATVIALYERPAPGGRPGPE